VTSDGAPEEKPGLGEAVQEKAAAALDRVTDAAATGVEKVAGALDAMTGGLFEQRLAETGAKVADTLRAVGDPDEDADDPTPS
jgi:hypothetical protein